METTDEEIRGDFEIESYGVWEKLLKRDTREHCEEFFGPVRL